MISAVLLSGGQGSRFNASLPKQYHQLCSKPIVLRSLEALLCYKDWKEVAIVCDPSYQSIFDPYTKMAPLVFAEPGKERQESVISGIKSLSKEVNWVCIHDGARPLLSPKDLQEVIKEGIKTGASALGCPIDYTLKEVKDNLNVIQTPCRSRFWEIQTPQVIKTSFLLEGYKKATQACIHATDDVFFAELLGHKVQLVKGSKSNFKITTPEDLICAEALWTSIHG